MIEPTLIAAMNESAYSGCASFYPEAGTICTERGNDHALWCDRCLLRTGAAAIAAETARADREAAARQEAEQDAVIWAGHYRHQLEANGTAERIVSRLRAELAALRG